MSQVEAVINFVFCRLVEFSFYDFNNNPTWNPSSSTSPVWTSSWAGALMLIIQQSSMLGVSMINLFKDFITWGNFDEIFNIMVQLVVHWNQFRSCLWRYQCGCPCLCIPFVFDIYVFVFYVKVLLDRVSLSSCLLISRGPWCQAASLCSVCHVHLLMFL